jgi:hypothetical protein
MGILSGTADTFGYDEGEVSGGGTLVGRVTLNGPKPPVRVFPLVLYPFGPFCKMISDGEGNVIVQEFIIGSDGGMQDAVVTVQDVRKGKSFPPIKPEFVSENCMFHPVDIAPSEHTFLSEDGRVHHEHPLVRVIQNHQPISVVNRDPVFHNGQIFQNERGNIILNFPLPVSDDPRGGVIHLDPGKRIAQLICGMHEFMQGWMFSVDNPYYALTKKDGAFKIDQIPPGSYRVIVWHPHLKPIEKELTVSDDNAVELNFEFDAATVKRPEYEVQKKFRIGPEAHPHEDLTGDKDKLLIQE